MKKALIIGGSGALSSVLAHMAKDTYEIWAVTRGNRVLEDGIIPLSADRNEENHFRKVILEANVHWDVIFDCICMNERHAKQDLEVLSQVSNRLVVISTDSVYDPARKMIPQREDGYFVEESGNPEELSYAANKRNMEKIFINAFNGVPPMKITIFRPGHIYGPGFLTGCYPEHSRQEELPRRILEELPLSLVGSGIYLTQPIFVNDLADVMLNCVENEASFGEIFCIGGPERIENRIYYEILGELLETPVTIKEIPLSGYAETHPEYQGHLCHRIYDLSKLEGTGIHLPATLLRDGLRCQLEALGFYEQIDEG